MPLNLTRELQQSYNNLMTSIDGRLANSYKTSLEQIQAQIKDIYSKFGALPSITEVMKYNRLSQFELDMIKTIKALDKSVKNSIGGFIEQEATGSYKSTLEAIAKSGLGFDFTSSELNQEGLKRFVADTLWFDAMSNNSASLITDVKREFETVLRANSREEIISGVSQGKSYLQIAKTIEDRFETSKNRSRMIAFTETHKAHSYGRNEGIKSALDVAKEAGIKANKVWRHNAVGKPREDHVDADGQFANEDGMFDVGGELLEAPGLGSDPSNNIYCHCSVEFEVDEKSLTEEQINSYKETKNLTEDELQQVLNIPESVSEIPLTPEMTVLQEMQSTYMKLDEIGTVKAELPFNTAGQLFSRLSEATFDYGKIETKSQLSKAKKLLEQRHGIKAIVVSQGSEVPINVIGQAIKDLDKIMVDLRNRVPYFEESNKPIRIKFVNDYRVSKTAAANYQGGRDPLMRVSLKQRIAINKNDVNNPIVEYYKDFTSARRLDTKTHSVAVNGFSANLRHGMGHHIEFGFHTFRDSNGMSMRELYDLFGKESIAKNISKYSTTNLSEFAAEVFSIITDPVYFSRNNHNKLPPEIENWFVEFLRIRR